MAKLLNFFKTNPKLIAASVSNVYVTEKVPSQGWYNGIWCTELRQVALGWQDFHRGWTPKSMVQVHCNKNGDGQILGALENMARNLNLR